jgi:hypothetical protein
MAVPYAVDRLFFGTRFGAFAILFWVFVCQTVLFLLLIGMRSFGWWSGTEEHLSTLVDLVFLSLLLPPILSAALASWLLVVFFISALLAVMALRQPVTTSKEKT